MNRVRVSTARRPRVYTIWSASFLVLLTVLACSAQTPKELSVEPTMVKGAATAPVTIVEFSDYQ